MQRLQRVPAGGVYTSPARLCVDAAGELVDCDDTRAARLLVAEGGELSLAEAERYGLIAIDDNARLYVEGRRVYVISEPAPEPEPEAPAPGAPKRRRGAADKAATGCEDKGSE